jgi:anaphase-promoting complex subunit 3
MDIANGDRGCVELILRQLVERYAAYYLHDTALYFAERLYYENSSDANLHTLASCYYRQGKLSQVCLVLQDCINTTTLLENKYLYALACVSLDKLSEAEYALTPRCHSNKLTVEAVGDTPGGACGVFLLGRICRMQHRREPAVTYYKLSLLMDPYLWCAIAELSDMGVAIDVKQLFARSPNNELQLPNLLKEAPAPAQDRHYGASSLLGGNTDHRMKQLCVAENLTREAVRGSVAGQRHGVSMSLGMSSMSLHVPFASPASMPSPSYSLGSSRRPPGGGGGLSNDAIDEHDSTFNVSFNDSVNSRHLSHISYVDRSYDSAQSGASSSVRDPRATLFGISTPGLTPITAATAGSSSTIAGAESGYEVKTAMRSSDTPLLSPPLLLLKTAERNANPAAAAVGGNRRVSFGPTARLSFSGALSADSAVTDDSAYDTALHDNPLSTAISGIAAPGPRNGSSIDDPQEYPFKLPRKSATDSSSAVRSLASHRSAEDSRRPLPHKAVAPFPAVGSSSDVHQQATNSASPRYQERKNGLSVASVGDDAMNNYVSDACYAASRSYVDDLVMTLARAYQMLCLYCCRACIDQLQSLPPQHYRSALVSQWIGRAYYEMNEYKPSILAHREMLRLEPFRLKGLEILSTALWHLKRDKELCSLAQQVVDVDKFAPETWCVVGNCFSLQKEPEAAIRFFQRSLQIDAGFTYAYTLTGHEHVSNEDLDKAVESFRAAILHNDRHYNAWYGLGSIYYRQERYELAEFHFRRALGINPASSVLHCYLGMALHAQANASKSSEALDVLMKACEKDRSNPQLHFQRAHILFSSGPEHLEDCLDALLVVEEHAPREPPVHAMLGQVYHRLGNLHKALWHLNVAMDLDPKEASTLKVRAVHMTVLYEQVSLLWCVCGRH